jgi:plastocyanin
MPTISRARRTSIAALVAAAALLVPSPSQARPSRAECRRACGELIALCEAQGAKPAFCRRSAVRQCRRLGLDWCTVETTTTMVVTTTTSTTSTTIDAGPTRNDCNRVVAEDHRGEALVYVEFTAFDYAPECIRVSPGTTVRFSGNFRAFPLIGGDVAEPDPASPFAPPTTEGIHADFVLSEPGIYPYYTEILWSVLFHMVGAVIVE